MVDRLTGETLAADNIVVLFANHTYENLAGTILKIRLLYLDRQPGLLFRNGQWYAIQWSTLKQNLMLQDEQGRPIALKPGQTYFEILSRQSTWADADHLDADRHGDAGADAVPHPKPDSHGEPCSLAIFLGRLKMLPSQAPYATFGARAAPPTRAARHTRR